MTETRRPWREIKAVHQAPAGGLLEKLEKTFSFVQKCSVQMVHGFYR
jgi:hypothetical protein